MGTLRFKLSSEDLAQIRFAFSPLWECVASLQAIQDPACATLHLPWLRQARGHLKKLDLSVAFALIPSSGYIPDFLTPPPNTPFPDFRSELEAMARTPPHIVRREVKKSCKDRQPHSSSAPPKPWPTWQNRSNSTGI